MSHSSDKFIKEHCIIGSNITKKFPIFNNISNIIKYHHENWNGSGPMRIKENSIPIQSQIIRIADLIELLYDEKELLYKQKEEILSFINKNLKIIFSEKIYNTFLVISSKDSFWFNIQNISYINFILDRIAPNLNIYLNLKQFNKIAYMFSEIIDNKSKFTAKHSKNISKLCYKISKSLNYPEEKCVKMKIARLLHDIGKLAIPINILNKNAPLSNKEFTIIKSHPYYTKLILDRIEDILDISD